MRSLNKVFSPPILYLAVACLYFLRLDYFSGSSIIVRGSFVLFFGLSFFYCIKANHEYRSASLRAINTLLVLVSLYGLILMILGSDWTWKRPTPPSIYLIYYYESLLPIYAFYYFSRAGLISAKWVRYSAILFFIFTFASYSAYEAKALMNSDAEEITNNAGYLFLSLVPLMAFFKERPLLQYLGLGIITFFVISGMKRGAILLCGVSLLFFILASLRNLKGAQKILIVILSAVLFYFVVHYIEYMLMNSAYFNKRLEATMAGQTGRDSLFTSYMDFYFERTNFFTMIFGSGAFAGLRYIGMGAHNDWLELLIEMGIIGIVVYLLYWINYYKIWKNSRRCCPEEVVMAFGLICLIYFGKSFWSQSITRMSIMGTFILGYCIGIYENNKILK